MALTVELLKQLIASLSPSEDTEAALNFLNQSDLTQAWSLYWLAGTSQNLYRARGLHEQIKFKGEIGLLKDAYAIDRNSSEVREALLKSLLDYFRHASHEWSACIILWGMDGATLDQCNEVMSEVTLVRELDRECAYALSIDEFESKLK